MTGLKHEHVWGYFKVIKNKPDFVNCVKRVCEICGLEEFVRRIESGELTNAKT